MCKTGRLVMLAICAAFISMFSTTAYADMTFYFTKADFDAAVSTTLLEDFESFVPKDVPLASFTSNGMTYSNTSGPWPWWNVLVASPGYNNFGAGVGITTTSILTATGAEYTIADFSKPPTAVGFDTYFNGLAPTTVEFFGTQGLLGTFVFDASLDNKGYLGVVSSDPITSFHWTNLMGGQLNTGIDNISVNTVPEPSLMVLLGISMMSLVGLRRWWKD